MDDYANLLSEEEEERLRRDYASLLEYVDAAVVTTADASYPSAESYAKSYVNREFGKRAAVAFFIDMSHREVWVYANKAGLDVVSRADARAITDNVYRYARIRQYYECANDALSQILTKCEGGRLARSVKHITNALIAIVVAVLLNYWRVSHGRQRLWEKADEGLREQGTMPSYSIGDPVETRTKTIHHERSSGGSYDGGGFSGGGFSDGGGFSGGGGGGGGGGHSF